MTKNNPSRLLAFFSKKHYGAYDKMIDELRPLLVNPQQSSWLIERLDFRPDLPRGSKNMIYLELARLLQSGSSVLRDGFCKNDLFRWLADPRHSNLGVNFQSIQRAVNKNVTS